MGIPGFRGFDQNTVRDSGKNNGIRDLTAATREAGLEKNWAWIREELLEKKTIFRRADDRRSQRGVDSREKEEGMRDQALLSRPHLEVLILFIMFMTVTPPPPPPNNSTLAGITGAVLKGIKKSRRRVENRIKVLAAPSLVQLTQTSISSHMRGTTALGLFLESSGIAPFADVLWLVTQSRQERVGG